MTERDRLQEEVTSLTEAGLPSPFLLYAMGLRLGTLDYESLATDDLLDGPEDKKVDFFDLDLEAGVATIAQGYESQDWDRPAPPANKAADLGIAINWLLESDLEGIPNASVQAAARELRESLARGEVTRLDVFYVHNLTPAEAVDGELGTVKRAADRLLERYGGDRSDPPTCLVRQVSRDLVDEWRRSQHEAISVAEDIVLHSEIAPQLLSNPEWRAVVATLKASDLVALRAKHGDALFSANVRDYLGSRQTSRNINRQIERTVESEPQNFWIYNNGITILTRGVQIHDQDLHLQGMAIINGAQTTGSLAEASGRSGVELGNAVVFARVIQCQDPSLIDHVIRFNNTQNPIKAWELRVLDPIQRKLTRDFEALGITYQTRRGQARRRASDILYERLGPYLAAFYGHPQVAHRNKAELYENEGRYRSLFDEDTHPKNLLFVYRLGEAIGQEKLDLKHRINLETASADDADIYDYFRYGAFTYVLQHICAEVLGLWAPASGHAYKRRIALEDESLFDVERAHAILRKLVGAVLIPLHQYVKQDERDAYQIFRVQGGIDSLTEHVKTMIRGIEQMQPGNYAEISSRLVLVDD